MLEYDKVSIIKKNHPGRKTDSSPGPFNNVNNVRILQSFNNTVNKNHPGRRADSSHGPNNYANNILYEYYNGSIMY